MRWIFKWNILIPSLKKTSQIIYYLFFSYNLHKYFNTIEEAAHWCNALWCKTLHIYTYTYVLYLKKYIFNVSLNKLNNVSRNFLKHRRRNNNIERYIKWDIVEINYETRQIKSNTKFVIKHVFAILFCLILLSLFRFYTDSVSGKLVCVQFCVKIVSFFIFFIVRVI